MWEFSVQVECPHCGVEDNQTATFDPDMLGDAGGSGHVDAGFCGDDDCGKDFWFRADMSIDIDCYESWITKPEPKGRAVKAARKKSETKRRET